MDKVDMALESCRDRISEGADSLDARARVREGGEVGVEEGVGLADVEVELEPVAGGGEVLGGEAMLLQPGVDGGDRVCARGAELVGLLQEQ